MDREWMKDIRECDGCHTEQYALPRYEKSTAKFVGYFCNRCQAQRGAAIDQIVQELADE